MAGFRSLQDLEQYMKGLANANRLELLEKLGRPLPVDRLQLSPGVVDEWGTRRRPIAKQAVRRHVRTLHDLGVLVELEGNGSDAPRYCVDVAKLFLFLEQLRAHLGSLQVEGLDGRLQGSGAGVPVDSFLPQNGSSRTLGLPANGDAEGVVGPRFELVRGMREGATFALDGEGDAGREVVCWTLGRLPHSDVRLCYDPYVAPVHARVVKRDGGFHLEDVPGNTNGTEHNWELLDEGASVRLRDKDVVGVGRSLLLFRV